MRSLWSSNGSTGSFLFLFLPVIYKGRPLICLVKVMVFSVVMYGYKSWTIKKAECQRIDAFELQCWRSFLRIPWTTKRSNQSILKEISPDYSLEGLMLKLKLQSFGHLMRRTGLLGKTRWWERLKAGGEGDDRGWNDWMASPTQWTPILFEQALGVGDGHESLACCSSWGRKGLDMMSDWPKLKMQPGKTIL